MGKKSEKLKIYRNKLRQYKAGHVLIYALYLFVLRKTKYRKDKMQGLKISNMYEQVFCQKVLYRLRKKYKKQTEKFAHEINETYDTLSHERSNKIWLLWFQKIENAPEIVRMCYQSILDNLGNDHEIILLNEDNYTEYIQLPEHIIDRYNKGQITKQILSDIIRLELLTKYGGTWMDATVFCGNNNIPKYILDSDLFIYQTMWPATWGIATVMNSWFITACQNNRILLLTKALMYEYFVKNKYPCDYWLIYDFFEIAKDVYCDDWSKVMPVCSTTPHILQDRMIKPFNKEIWDVAINSTNFHKLNWRFTHEEMSTEGTFCRYLLNNYKKYEVSAKTAEDGNV